MAEFVWVRRLNPSLGEMAVDLHLCRKYVITDPSIHEEADELEVLFLVPPSTLDPSGWWVRLHGSNDHVIELRGGEILEDGVWRPNTRTVWEVSEWRELETHYRGGEWSTKSTWGEGYAESGPGCAAIALIRGGFNPLPPELLEFEGAAGAGTSFDRVRRLQRHLWDGDEQPTPRWDARGRSLYLGDLEVRRFPRKAPNLFALMDAFEAGRWAIPTASPFDSDRQLRDTVEYLNKTLPPGPPIEFGVKDGRPFWKRGGPVS